MVDSHSKLTWLHISDFHFAAGNKYDSDVVLNAFLTSLPELIRRHGKPDLIFATGDIAQSGKEAEYHDASVFLDKLLAITELSKKELFVIPGNHDIDRQRGRGLARTLKDSREADVYFDASEPLIHVSQRQAAFGKWYDAYFTGVRTFPLNTTCINLETTNVNGTAIQVLSINSAAFCYDDHDHGKLWVGRRCFQSVCDELASDNATLRVALIHHPFDWLSSAEQSNIKSMVRSGVDCVLSGHLHQTDADQLVGVSGDVVHLAAGAMYQTRDRPNTAMFCSLARNELSVCPIRYEDKPREVWTVDTSIYPSDPNYQGQFTLKGLVGRSAAVNTLDKVEITSGGDNPQSIISGRAQTAKAEFEQDLFVTPTGALLYAEPRLMTRQQQIVSPDEESAQRITIPMIIDSSSSYLIEARSEFGSSTLARRLMTEFTSAGHICFLKDAKTLPNYRKKLESEFPSASKVESGESILILDNFDPERDERLLKELNHTKWFCRLILLTTHRGLKPPSLTSLGDLSKNFELLFIWTLSRDDIRSMAASLFESGDQSFISSIVDKVYSDLLGLCIPLTPSNVIMYLRVLHREGEFQPLNRVDILGRYISEMLRRSSDAYSDSFNAKNKIDIFGAFVFSLYKSNASDFDDKDWNAFVDTFQKDTLSEFDGASLLQELIDSRIVIRASHRIYLKYSFYFSYFLGRHIAHRPALLAEFLRERGYLQIKGVVDVITGISAENTLLLGALTTELSDLLKEFSEKYLPSDFDPLSGAIWPDTNEEEKLWSSVAAEMSAGPKSVNEIDIIKTSVLAEARTADQEVRYAKFLQMETSLFALARLLTEALKNCDDVGGQLKINAHEAILKTHFVAYQLGCVFAETLSQSSVFQWGGVIFIGFDKANDGFVPEEPDEGKAVTRVITSLSRVVIDQCREDLGAHKLAGVFKARENEAKNVDLFSVMNFACILNAKGQNWSDTLSKIIQKTDKNAYNLSLMLSVLMNHLGMEILQNRDREQVKRLVALIEAKRSLKKQAPGAKFVNRMLTHLEKINRFERDPNAEVQ